uniref:FAS1 domain-containing protein n=1 Tax=Timema monikensis TaxID=170555 RepID=A0A7R9EEJ8_9NEOP|nr:unnamed protein product [Timema monikensis]
MNRGKRRGEERDIVPPLAKCPGYYVEWQGEWIHVFRPDVECTNGIIHVIDSVFLKAGDVRVSGGGVAVPLLAPQLAMLLMAKWLLL